MAVDSARYSTYSRDDAAAAAGRSVAAGGGSSRVSRVRSSTDPEKYAVYAAMRNDASAPSMRLGLLASRELECVPPSAVASEATERGYILSPDSEDVCAASFSGFALRRPPASGSEAPAAVVALHRARPVADIRMADRPYIYDIIEDLPDAAVYDRIYTKHMLASGRRLEEAAAAVVGEHFSSAGRGGDGGLPKPPIRRVASERRAPSAVETSVVDDDYGFLCYNNKPDAAVAEIMQKDSSSSKRFFNKKKRNSKSTSRQPSISGSVWCYEDKGKWMNDAGVSLTLEETARIVHLSEKEYSILQKICLVRLQSMDLGCPVTIPKGDTKRKRFGLKKKRSNTINLGHLLEHLKESTKRDKEEPPQSSGWVFAIPLSRALMNDVILKRRRSSLLREMSDSGNLSSPSCHGTEPSAESSQNSLLDDSKEEDASSRDVRVSPAANDGPDKDVLLPHKPAIPHFVATCFRYLEKHGLNVLGIFRVCSSKIRIKQLHDEFDSGREVKLDEEHNPHDVAALLKEYFRELPEPLLCKDLYEPFLATRAINDPQKRLTALRYVISLLPTPNRDLLHSLLKFLVNVHNHSNDTYDGRGNVLAGNKMDSFNLATLFGPNVLRKMKTSNDLDQPDFAEKTRDVISVVREMIDNCETLFSVPVELQDEVLKTLVETDHDSANFILSYRLDSKDECRTDIGSEHGSCSSVTVPGLHPPPSPETGLSKSASSPAPFLHSSPSSPQYPTRMAKSATSKDGESFDMGNYVELRSPRLTLTLPQPSDGRTIGAVEKESPTSPFYAATSLPGSPQTCAANRSATQLGPWLAYPLPPRPNSYTGSRPGGRDPEQQQSPSGNGRYLSPGSQRPGGRRENAAPGGSTSKHRPLSVVQRGDGGGDFGEGPETLV